MNNRLIFAVDMILTTAVFVLSYFIRKAVPGQVALYPMTEYLWLLFVILPTLCLAMNYYGFYSNKKSLDVFSIIYKLLICFIICGIVSAAAVFITKNALFSRLYFGIFLAADYIVLLTERLILRKIIIDSSKKNAGIGLAVCTTIVKAHGEGFTGTGGFPAEHHRLCQS